VNRLKRLLADRRGMVLTVEVAMLLPMLLLLTAGAIEAGLMLMTDASLEMAVRMASRYGITGAGGADRETTIRKIILAGVGRWMGDKGTLTLDMKVYTSFDNIGKPEPFVDANNNGTWDEGETYTDSNKNGHWDPDMGIAGAGGAGDVMLYSVTISRPGFSGVLGIAGITQLTFSRQMAVQNE
jgi:Flp pilus assembly protein TadG